jgi:hypothetical protein
MDIYQKSLITLLGVSLVSIVIGIPLALRKIPRNAIYGFRTRTTMNSDELWFSANAHFGRGIIIASIGSSMAATGTYLLRPLPPEFIVPASVLIMVLPSLIATLATLRHLRNLRCSGKQKGSI